MPVVKTPEDRGFKFDWERRVAQCRLGSATKSVAAWLCSHADTHGRGAHPGVRRLAFETEQGESTVRRCLEKLRDLGLIVRVMRGSVAASRNYADKYILAIPDDLESRVTVLPEPTPQRGGHGRGGKANHVRWHDQRGKFDPECVHCAEGQGGLASIPGGSQEPFAKPSPAIRPPLGRISDQGSDGSDHRSVEEHQQAFTTKHDSQNSARPLAGSRASSRARDDERFGDFFAARWAELVTPGEKLSSDDAAYVRETITREYVEYVLADIDAVEDSTVEGMLSTSNGKAIVNKIRGDRGESKRRAS